MSEIVPVKFVIELTNGERKKFGFIEMPGREWLYQE